MLRAALSPASELDRAVMLRLNGWHAPVWIRFWMLAASKGGDGWFWFFLGCAITAAQGAAGFRVVAIGFAAWVTGVATFKSLKWIAPRERPCVTQQHVWAKVRRPRDRFSFPSGHTISAFAITLPWSFAYPALLAPLLFMAVSIAASRVVLGLHYLSDVIAGFFIGITIGVAAIYGLAWADPGQAIHLIGALR